MHYFLLFLHFSISGIAMPCYVRDAYSSRNQCLFPQLQVVQITFHHSKDWLRDTMTQSKSTSGPVQYIYQNKWERACSGWEPCWLKTNAVVWCIRCTWQFDSVTSSKPIKALCDWSWTKWSESGQTFKLDNTWTLYQGMSRQTWIWSVLQKLHVT